jgi:EmrB/QacA subfamily drug resistance transporter
MLALSKRRMTFMLLSIAIGSFMSVMDSNVVNVVLPVIQNDYHVTLSIVEWVVTAYLLIVSSMLLTFGRLSDIFGHRKVYLTGFIIFTLGSLLCGLSANIGMLIGCRIFQALGAGMMFSSNFAIITEYVATENRGKAFSVTAIAVAVGCCVGPVVGGVLASLFGWQSIFFMNIPFGIVGIFLAAKSIPKDLKGTPVPFDIRGSILIFVALFLILLPLNLASNESISPILFAGLLTAGLIFLVVFILIEGTSKYPLLNLGLFQNRIFSANLIASSFNYMSQFILAFIAPFYLENVLMLSTAMTGLIYIPMPLAMILVAPFSGRFSDRHDSRIIAASGMGVMALGLFLLCFVKLDTPYWYIILAMILTGAGSGMFQIPNNSTVMGNAPAQHRGAASGVLATMRNIGMVIGVVISGALFSYASIRAKTVYASYGLSGSSLTKASYVTGMQATVFVAVIAALLAMVFSLIQKRKEKLESV